MNNWLFFALSGPILWALGNVMDGTLRRNFIKNEMALTWLSAIGRLPFVILLFSVTGFNLPPIHIVLMMAVVGFFWTLPMFFYYKAMEIEKDTSRVSLLVQLVPIFTLPSAYLIVHERLTAFQGVAFIFLIIAGALAGIKRMMGKWHMSKAFFLITLSCFLWAFSDVLFKKLEPLFANYLSAFTIYFLGGFLVSTIILFIPKGRKTIFKSIAGLPRKAWIMVFVSLMSGIIGGLSFNYALTLGKASLTSVLMGVQPLMVIVLGIVLRLFIKDISKEDLSINALIFKGLSFLFLIGGLIFLQF
jgi:drug/metabolite transporter (DMT)-like permease